MCSRRRSSCRAKYSNLPLCARKAADRSSRLTREVRDLELALDSDRRAEHAGADANGAAAGLDGHIDRPHHELRFLPCSPGCANWLCYGIQPD
jgi:hypothetical protein